MRKLLLLGMLAVPAIADVIQVDPNAIEITLTGSYDQNGNMSVTESDTLYFLGGSLSILFNGSQSAEFANAAYCGFSSTYCFGQGEIGLGFSGPSGVSHFVEVATSNTEVIGVARTPGFFTDVKPGVYNFSFSASGIYSGPSMPTGTYVNYAVISGSNIVSLSPYTFPIPEPETWLLLASGGLALWARSGLNQRFKRR